MRRKLVVGNWKMHGSLAHNAELMANLRKALADCTHADFSLCVPHPYLFQAQSLLQGSNITWGGQNVSRFMDGPYTGDVSASMLKDFGCTHAIIGHSERRVLIHETNTTAAASFGAALQAGLTPIFCVGETLEEREAGLAQAVVESQLVAILSTLGADVFNAAVKLRSIVSYEPVWAIGTDKTATPQQAQAMHAFIRGKISEYDANVAKRVRIIYGGSVTPANASRLFEMPDIDGGLIGRCSLATNDFVSICLTAEQISAKLAQQAAIADKTLS
jgi:triosephosphate isomerase (TIM)